MVSILLSKRCLKPYHLELPEQTCGCVTLLAEGYLMDLSFEHFQANVELPGLYGTVVKRTKRSIIGRTSREVRGSSHPMGDIDLCHSTIHPRLSYAQGVAYTSGRVDRGALMISMFPFLSFYFRYIYIYLDWVNM